MNLYPITRQLFFGGNFSLGFLDVDAAKKVKSLEFAANTISYFSRACRQAGLDTMLFYTPTGQHEGSVGREGGKEGEGGVQNERGWCTEWSTK